MGKKVFFKGGLVSVSLAVIVLFLSGCFDSEIDFNAQVKPIFNKKCISCHGGVKAKGGFSLLFREEALAPTKSGKPAIIPGDPDGSEFIRRLTLSDPEERMPYKHEALPEEEISILRRWVAQGAEWGQHWAYVPVQPVAIPNTSNEWVKTDLDRFILEKMEENDLQPSPMAAKEQLLRRVSLDLIGFPAPDSIASKFLKSKGDESAYQILVKDLLATPFYGEKWASMWLDLSRYADTRGYEADRGRVIWKYRDWVIKAFNKDQPYDQFITEQMAGDLFPDATDDQYIATGFHRNAMTNDEGGSDNEEFRTSAVLDRINTTWTGILGSSFSCVQCHSHPYDPFRHEEYYKFMAYFNNDRDEDTESEYPLLRQYAGEDSLKLIKLKQWMYANLNQQVAKDWYLFLKTWQPTINSLQCDQFENAALVSSWYAALRKDGSFRLPNAVMTGKDRFQFRFRTGKPGGICEVHQDSLKGPVIATIALSDTKNSWDIQEVALKEIEGKHHLFFTYKNQGITNRDETAVLFEWFRFTDPFPGEGTPGYDSAFSYYKQLLKAPVSTTPILYQNSKELTRVTQVFERGNWLVKGKEVTPGVPEELNPEHQSFAPNRMGLAQWMVSKQNPLTARTMVNRVWEQVFGKGLVETLEDLGSQGAMPTHQALLDWLSWKFMNEDGWSVKKLISRIVSSATYQQQSILTEELKQKDPDNRWYTRAPRLRLTAEQLRDQALFVSGLLSTKMYGPGVMPFQPEGIWNSPYNGARWVLSEGEHQYRRAVYTYMKRSAAYPSMVIFDGPARQVCNPRRIRTNTPLQALALLNDPAYLEMARNFAYSLQSDKSASVQQQIGKGFLKVTGHAANQNQLKSLQLLYEKALVRFRQNGDASCEMVGLMNEHVNPETAAMITVANALLNLDEVVTRS